MTVADLPRLASAEQQAAIIYPDGNVYVGAGPGTGKTFLLVERYRFLRQHDVAAAQILVLTFSRRAAAELTARLAAARFPSAEIDVRTFHGFAARVIAGGDRMMRTGRLLDGCSRRILLDAAVARTPTAALNSAVKTSRGFRNELQTILADLTRLAAPALAGMAVAASPRLRDVLAIARAAAAARKKIGGTEIGELVVRAVVEAGLAGSVAAGWLAGRYSHVLIDEFQDTDRNALELLERLATLGATIFAVGDEAQSIYRFRGASNDIVARAQQRFAMRRFDLTVSRRCPPDVCDLASQTPFLNAVPLQSAHTSGTPVEVVRYRAVDDEVAALADAIESELETGRSAEQIAVLMRSFRPVGPLLRDELRRRSIAVTAVGREELLADARITTLRAALVVLDQPNEPAHWERLLTAGPLQFEPIRVRFARDVLTTLRLDGSLADGLTGLCADGVMSGGELAAALLWAAEAWRAGDLGSASRRLVRGLRLLAAVLHDEAPANVRAAAARLKLVCDALAGAQHTAAGLGLPSGCTDLVANIDDLLPELALDDAEFDPSAPGVRVLTVHAAKGLEFERVFVADAVAGRFPQEPRASKMLDADDRASLAGLGCDGPSVLPEAAADEEASLWYVALTRTTGRLTITYADHDLNGDLQRPSRFLPLERRPKCVTSADRESLATQALRHGSAALRQAVLAGEAVAYAPAMADYARNGSAAFGALRGRPLRRDQPLGVGDAELWLQCPRRLFYKQFAKLPDEESAALVLGSTLHDVLERFHAEFVRFDPATADVDAWTAQLLTIAQARWNDARFASPVVARAARTAAEVALRSYARALALRARERPFRVEARERRIGVPAGSFALAGRVDRIDTFADGTRAVVDYKLGAAKAETVAKAAKRIVDDWLQADSAARPREPLVRRLPAELRLQLGLYAAALENVSQIAYVFLGGESQTYKRNGAVYVTEAFAGPFHDVVQAALHEIETGLLAPLAAFDVRALPVTFNAEICTFCPYRGVCPGPEERDA